VSLHRPSSSSNIEKGGYMSKAKEIMREQDEAILDVMDCLKRKARPEFSIEQIQSTLKELSKALKGLTHSHQQNNS